MMRIHKGDRTLEVTKGAFRNFYQRLGYKPVRGSRSPEKTDEVNTHPDEEEQLSGMLDGSSEDDTGYSEEGYMPLEEIPLSEMTHSQLFEYAEQLGIEFEADASAKSLRKLIRQQLS